MARPRLRTLYRRPRVGMMIETRYGVSIVERLLDRDGVKIEIRTPVHGTLTLERALTGWWTVARDSC